MNRRMLWGSIAVVVLVLVGTSVMSNRGSTDPSDSASAWMPEMAAWVRTHPGIPVGVIAGIGVVLAMRGGGRARKARRDRREADAGLHEVTDQGDGFADALDDAIRHGGPDGRRHQVLVLHRDGRSVGEIARATRLSQDAVRAVIDAG